MAKLSAIRKDVGAAANGVEVEVFDGMFVTVREMGVGNKKYGEVLTELLKPYRTYSGEIKGLSNEQFVEIEDKAIVEAIIVDWRGIEDDDGNEIKFSKDKAFELIRDPAYAEFRNNIVACAKEKATFREEFVKATSKN